MGKRKKKGRKSGRKKKEINIYNFEFFYFFFRFPSNVKKKNGWRRAPTRYGKFTHTETKGYVQFVLQS